MKFRPLIIIKELNFEGLF